MKTRITLFILCMFLTLSGFSQTKTYFTSGGEMIFSFANIEDHGVQENSIVRWSPVFNFQSMYNVDFGQHVGLFTGFAIRNVGYIYGNYKVADPSVPSGYVTVKKKFRSYNFAVPVGLKLGNLGKTFIYGGYEVEIPFHYKEKTFEDGDKTKKITGWFSDRQESLQHGFLVGIQFPYGTNLKFKYYMSNFHNENFKESNGNKPYEGLKSNIFYFSICTNLFKDLHYSNPSKSQNANYQAMTF